VRPDPRQRIKFGDGARKFNLNWSYVLRSILKTTGDDDMGIINLTEREKAAL